MHFKTLLLLYVLAIEDTTCRCMKNGNTCFKWIWKISCPADFGSQWFSERGHNNKLVMLYELKSIMDFYKILGIISSFIIIVRQTFSHLINFVLEILVRQITRYWLTSKIIFVQSISSSQLSRACFTGKRRYLLVIDTLPVDQKMQRYCCHGWFPFWIELFILNETRCSKSIPWASYCSIKSYFTSMHIKHNKNYPVPGSRSKEREKKRASEGKNEEELHVRWGSVSLFFHSSPTTDSLEQATE